MKHARFIYNGFHPDGESGDYGSAVPSEEGVAIQVDGMRGPLVQQTMSNSESDQGWNEVTRRGNRKR